MENKLKKIVVYIFIVALFLSKTPSKVHAGSQLTTYNNEEIVTYAEEVKWYYRDVNGRQQKRLWSRTYGYWITDWIWV